MLYFSRSLIQETPYLQTLIRSRGSVIICLTEMCWTCWSRVTRLEQKTCQLQSESVLYCSLFDHRRKVFLRLLRIFTLHFFLQALLRNILRHPRFMENVIVKSNQIKSLLLSHHHSTSALVSEILMSVLQTVKKKKKKKKTFTYGQYIFTDCTEDNVQNTHTYTQYTQCTIKTYLIINYTLYTVWAHLHYVHYLYII